MATEKRGDGVRRGSDASDGDPSMGVPPEVNLASSLIGGSHLFRPALLPSCAKTF